MQRKTDMKIVVGQKRCIKVLVMGKTAVKDSREMKGNKECGMRCRIGELRHQFVDSFLCGKRMAQGNNEA